MRRAIEENRTPHLLALHYDPVAWCVRNLILIPSFALTISCLEKRRPLAPTARRKGWIGCNILLFNIPADARIALISDGSEFRPVVVRRQFSRLQPLETLGHDKRGWTLDVLKVDKAFVDGVAQGPEDAALAAAIVRLGHTLHLQTVAEGVEAADQVRHLRKLGCEQAQGYLFAKPLPAEQIPACLEPGHFADLVSG